MATYSNGESTTIAILAASKKLFYNKGYSATHCSEIADEAGVNYGLIHYHFKSKSSIALKIYMDFLESSRNRVRELISSEPLFIRNAVENILYWRIIEKNKAFRRFICEISLERIPLKLSQLTGLDYFSSINKIADVKLTDKTLELLCACNFAAENEMILRYSSDMSSFSADYMAELDIRLLFELFSVPYEIIRDTITRATELCSNLDVSVSEEFLCKIETKNFA